MTGWTSRRSACSRSRIEELCGLIFVNLDDHAAPLAELVGDLPARLARYRIPSLAPSAPGGGTQPANWKVIAENYIEGYHIPIAHPALMRLLDYKRYQVEVHDHYVWFEAPLRERPSSNRLERLYTQLVEPMPGLGEEDRRVWRYVFMYPNTTIDLYPDQVNTWQMLPDGVSRTRDVFASYRPRHSGPRTRLVQWCNQRLNTLVLDEDIDLVDNVQQGLANPGVPLRSAVAARGRRRMVRGSDPSRRRHGTRGEPSVCASAVRARADPAAAVDGSRARGSTTSGSRGSRWMRASRPRSCTTTSPPGRRSWPRHWTTPTLVPATRGSPAASCPPAHTPSGCDR